MKINEAIDIIPSSDLGISLPHTLSKSERVERILERSFRLLNARQTRREFNRHYKLVALLDAIKQEERR